ncbi:Glutaminase [Aphelenchoides fujianensis]|nr:Glutaminase [Aphelenchoides fujianensis]
MRLDAIPRANFRSICTMRSTAAASRRHRKSGGQLPPFMRDQPQTAAPSNEKHKKLISTPSTISLQGMSNGANSKEANGANGMRTVYSEQTLNAIGEILDRKKSVARILGEAMDSLQPSFEFRNDTPEDVVYDLFKIPNSEEEASIGKLLAVLKSLGLREQDPRLAPMMAKISEFEAKMSDETDIRRYRLPKEQFKDCIHPSISLISQALRNELIIPSWKEFTEKIAELFNECRSIDDGELATYIPQLARQDRNTWGMSICTIDGQRFSIGDSTAPFCFQSVSKAFNYAIVSSDLGAEYVHKFVGHEPSGRLFNEICLGGDNKPHNPMINAGAIIVTSLMKRGLCMADRYDFAYNEYKKFSAGEFIGFNNSVFLSERDSSSRNFSLAYFLKEHKCFPPGIESCARSRRTAIQRP